MKFSENLIRLRKARGLSQEELGSELSVARQTISKWETGETSPDLPKLMEAADFFGVSIDYLCGRETDDSAAESAASAVTPAGCYEFVSRRRLCGLPLVHIKFGWNRPCRAKGIIAIGNAATGVVAVGGASMGIVAIGGAAVGIFSLGGIALGLLAAMGGIAVGAVAIGGFAAGLIAVGGAAVGLYSAGGFALAEKIALSTDGFAKGHIAIGSHAHGNLELPVNVHSADEIKSAILGELPDTPKWLAEVFAVLAGR